MTVASFILLTAAALALAGWRRGHAAARDRGATLANAPRHLREIVVAVPVAVAGVILSLVVQTHYQLTWYLPYWMDTLLMRLLWVLSGGLFMYVFGAGLAVAWHERHAERFKLLAVAVATGSLLLYRHLQYTTPIHGQLNGTARPDGLCLQTSSSSCGPAAAVSILHHFGIRAGERELAEAAGTTRLGTSASHLERALRQVGIAARKRTLAPSELTALDTPAILLVEFPGMGPDSHAVACFPRGGGRFLVSDPLAGPRECTAADLAPIWHGHLIECRNR